MKDREEAQGGTWRQDLKQRPWKIRAWFPLLTQPVFLYDAGPPALGGTPHSELALTHQS